MTWKEMRRGGVDKVKKEYLKRMYPMQADAQMMERAARDFLSEKGYLLQNRSCIRKRGTIGL